MVQPASQVKVLRPDAIEHMISKVRDIVFAA